MPPGKEGKIVLAVEHTESLAGEVAKSASVTTNDPVKPTFTLMLRAHFKIEHKPGAAPSPLAIAAEGRRVGPFAVAPADRWTASVIRGQSTTGVLSITNREPAPVKIKEVNPGGDKFIVALQTIEEGKRYTLSVTTSPVLKPGQHLQSVKLITDSKVNPEIPIELDVTVYPLVLTTPARINMRGLPSSVDLSQINLPMIYVRKIREGGLQIKKATTTLPFLKLDVITENEGSFYQVRMTIDKSKVSGPAEFTGAIRIETNDLETPVIEIPVVGSFT